MQTQIERLVGELRTASDEARALVEGSSESVLTARPGPGRWSAAECLAHLVVTSEAYVPLMAGALKAHAPSPGKARFRMDTAGWLIKRSLEPPVRIRTRTVEEFLPRAFGSPREILTRFLELQEGPERVLQSAEGFDLNAILVVSPFNRRIRYNLYSCFRIILAHQRRHLWQARRAASGALRSTA